MNVRLERPLPCRVCAAGRRCTSGPARARRGSPRATAGRPEAPRARSRRRRGPCPTATRSDGSASRAAPTRVRVVAAVEAVPAQRARTGDLLDAGYDVRLLALEDMTLYEQVAALRATTVLVGVHGSGLNNALYLRPARSPADRAVRPAVPRRRHRDAERRQYGERVRGPERSVFHWGCAPSSSPAGRRCSTRGRRPAGTFWVNPVPRSFPGAAASLSERNYRARRGRRRRRQRASPSARRQPRRTARTAGVQSRATVPPFMTTSQRAIAVDSWGSQATSASAGCRGTSSGVLAGRRCGPPSRRESRSQSTSAAARVSCRWQARPAPA